jgi:hypothetical protein
MIDDRLLLLVPLLQQRSRVSSSSIDATVRRRRSPTSMPIASSRPVIRSRCAAPRASLAVLELDGVALADGHAHTPCRQAHRLVGQLAAGM